jgi:nitrogen fixation NifU-like protein
VKIHCSVLAEDAIRAAVADYQKKREAGPARRAAQGERTEAGVLKTGL